ncbi:MAG: hypothetical protein ABII00_02380 [Elusimicrobiota bacterium]
MKGKRDLYVIGAVFLVLLALFLITRRSGELPGAESFSGVKLAAVGSSEGVELGSCPTPKCLTVYVAPWCGVCRSSTALINGLKAWLGERGVQTRVVVGMGQPAEVEEYAREFGPETLVDPAGQVPVAGGVPQFIVSDASGEILKRMPGVPRIIRPPIPEEDLRSLADYLGLP